MSLLEVVLTTFLLLRTRVLGCTALRLRPPGLAC